MGVLEYLTKLISSILSTTLRTVLFLTLKIDSSLLDSLTAQARLSPRLRMNFDLRNSPSDGSQRMLNALEPGTPLPIHRHRFSSETVMCLREMFYDWVKVLARCIYA